MDAELDAAAAEIAALAAQMQAEIDALVASGAQPGEVETAVMELQRRFDAEFLALMVRHMSAVPGGEAFGVRKVSEMTVGEVSLSTALYANARRTAVQAAAIVRNHALGVQQARALGLQLYDGYSPSEGVLRPLEGTARAKLPKALRALTQDRQVRADLTALVARGQAQAGRLKTQALRAAYSEAFDTWSHGAGREALARKLEVAVKEKTRYFANRIAQTELARAHQDALARELMADRTIEVVQVVLSGSHPRRDICDLHARANLFGLGPGCYPKARAPKPTFHAFCRCRLRSRPELSASMARDPRGGEAAAQRAFLRELPVADAARVMGSRAKLQRVLDGADPIGVVNRGVPQGYRTVRLGEGAQGKIAGMDSVAFNAFFKNEPGSPPRISVATLSDADRALLRTTAEELWLSRMSLDEHKMRHPEITAEDYLRVPQILRDGQVWGGHADRRYLLLMIAGKPYRAALKIDATGREAWFLSLVVSPKQKPPKGAVRLR